MRDTFADAVPQVHPISGAPLGESYLTSYQIGRRPRPITYISLTLEPHDSASWPLWAHEDGMYVYRTTSRTKAIDTQPTSRRAATMPIATYSAMLAIGQRYLGFASPSTDHLWDDDQRIRALLYHDGTRGMVAEMQYAGIPDGAIVLYARNRITHDHLAVCAPITFDRARAGAAAILSLTTAELACSVRLEHGRWVIETGTGSTLVTHGTCVTKDEAMVVAQAIRDRAWIAAVERIRVARGGTLDWGVPIPMPYRVQVYG